MKTTAIIGALFCLLAVSCKKPAADEGRIPAKSPAQAASSLDESFATASPAVKQDVQVVSDALRKREFEKAVVSLQVVQQAPNITLQQGLAIHNSSILLEKELINAIERGDPRAKQAYNLLKQMKRN